MKGNDMRTAQILTYALAGFMWGLVGALLLTDRLVPAELYVAAASAAAAATYLTKRPGDVSSAHRGDDVATFVNGLAVEPPAKAPAE